MGLFRGAILFLAALGLIVWNLGKVELRTDAALTIAGFGAWGVVTKTAYTSSMPLGTAGGMSALRAILALSFLTVGFAGHVRAGRVWGFVVLGSTLVKVLLYDLSEVSMHVRSVVLGALGLVMLISGYIAIRSRADSEG